MADKGLYLEVAGGVEKKLLQDLESLEGRLKSLLEGMKTKPQTKQFKRVQEQIKLLSNMFGALKGHFQESAGAIEKSAEGITQSLKELANSSDPALQEFSTRLETIQDEFSGAHTSIKEIIPDLEKFISLIEGFDGGNTRSITAKYKSLSEAVENTKEQFVDLEESAKGVYELKPKTPEVQKVEAKTPKLAGEQLQKVVSDFSAKTNVLVEKIIELEDRLTSMSAEAQQGFTVSEKQAKKFEKAVNSVSKKVDSLKKEYQSISPDPVKLLEDNFGFLEERINHAKESLKDLKDEIDSAESFATPEVKEQIKVGTEEGGNVFDPKMRLQDKYNVDDPEVVLNYLDKTDEKIQAITDALKNQGEAWKEIEDANKEIKESLEDASAEQGAEQAIEVLTRWKVELDAFQDALNRQGSDLRNYIETQKESIDQSEKSTKAEERSLEEKKRIRKEAQTQLKEEAEERRKLSEKSQEQSEKSAEAVEESSKKQSKARKRRKKAVQEEAKVTEQAGEKIVDSTQKTAKETEKIAEEQKEKITEPVAAEVDFSKAEEQFKNFTEKVEQGVTDLSNSIKGIFSSLEDLIREGVRTVEISVTPKGFDETVGKQERLDEALLKSAKTAEEVSQREQQAFLDSAAAFISASDIITEHQKEVDDALEHSGDVAEKVSDKEREAFSGISAGGEKIKAPEAESGTLDLMAQLLVQVTRNLDLMSQKLNAAKENVRDFNEDIKDSAKHTGDFADEAEKAASEEKIQHLNAYNEVYARMSEFLGKTAESMSGAKSRAKELASQVVKLGISLRETGVLKTNEEFEEWVNSLKAADIALADNRGAIERTAKGFRPLIDGSAELLGITDEMNEKFQKNSDTVTLYEKRLYELQKAYAAGDKGAVELSRVLQILGERVGKNDTAFKRFNDLVTKSNQHLKDLARRADESSEEVIDSVDLAGVAFEAYEGNIKVTKDSLEVLNEDGYKPFIDLNEDAARSLGLIGRKFDKAAQDSAKYKESIQKASDKTDFYSEAMRKLSEKYGDSEFHTKAYNKAIRETQRYISEVTALLSYEISELEREIRKRQEAGQSIEDLNNKLESKKRHLKEVTHETNAAEVALDRYEDQMKGTDKAFRRFNKYITMSSKNIGFLGKSFSMIGKRMKQFAAFALAAAAVQQLTEAVRVFIEVLSDYDQALYNLMAILEVTYSRVSVLGDQIQKVAQDTKFSATEVAGAVQTLGQAGLTIQEVGIALVGVTRLATGTLSDIGDVADLTTTALNSFRLKSVETTRTSDIFANAINNSKLNVDKLRTAFNYVGAAGKQVGLNLNELTGTLMVLADNGIRASTMGTGLRRMMLKMLSPTTELKAELEQLGMNAEDLNPKLVGWETAVKNLIPVLWDAEKQSMDMAKTVDYFGTRAAQVAAIVVRSVADGSNAISDATEKTYEFGAAQEMAEKQQRGLALSIKNLQDRFKNVAIAIGEQGVTGVIKDFIDALRHATQEVYETIKSMNRFWADVVGWGSIILILTAGFSGLSKILFKYRKQLTKLRMAVSVLNKALLAKAGIIGSLLLVFDQLVSWHFEAAEAAAKHSQELSLAATAMKNWGDTIEKAFATREWENTIKRFKEETEKAGGEVANLADKVEKKLGYSIDEISGPAGLQKFHEAWEQVRMDDVSESLDKSVVSLQNTIGSMSTLHALGVDFNKEFDNSRSILGKWGNSFYETSLKVMGLGVAGEEVQKTWEGFIDLFGPDKQELIQQLNENLDGFVLSMNEAAQIKGWDTEELIFQMELLGEEIGTNTFLWDKMTEKMAASTFAPIISGLQDLLYAQRKEMLQTEEAIALREEEGVLSEDQELKLESLANQYDTTKDAIENFEENLKKVIDREMDLKEAMVILQKEGKLTQEEINKLSLAMEKRLVKQTGKALTSFDKLTKKLRNAGVVVVDMYKQLDAEGKMEFDSIFAEVLDDAEKYRKYLNSLPDEFRTVYGDIDQIVDEYAQKKLKKELKGLLEINEQLEEHRESYIESYEELNEHLIDIFEARKDIVNRHYDWEKRRIEENVDDEGEVLRKTVELERKRVNDVERLVEQEYQARKSTVERETQDLMNIYRDNIEDRENVQEEGNDKIRELDDEINEKRKDNLNEWLDVLQESYSEAKALSREYADEVKSLEGEILDLQKERAENVRDIEQNLANDLREIRRAGMTDAEALKEEFRYAAEMYQQGLDLINLGEYDKAKESLKEAVGIYGDTAREAAEAEKQGEQYARSQAELTNRLKNTYDALKEAETKQKESAISGLKKQISSFEELKTKIDESAEKYRLMAEEVMVELKEIDNFEIADKQYKIKSNVKAEISNVRSLVGDLNSLAGKTFTYYLQGVQKKAAGGLIEGAKRMAIGGGVPGSGTGDKVPALLEPGEFVIPRRIVDNLGLDYFQSLLNGANESIQRFDLGGLVKDIPKIGSRQVQTKRAVDEGVLTVRFETDDMTAPVKITDPASKVAIRDFTKELSKRRMVYGR